MVDSSPKLSGEPTVEALSNGLATLGRYGDNYMVHAAEGETIIPKEILDANPGLKDDLFRQMTMMGVEDPNRYVVGSDLNSINPITGQPEFFFKKIFGVIKKIAKKILPVAAPIIGNLIAPGIGGPMASALLAKVQGGSWGDAAKSAALSYGVGALGRGLQGGFAAGPGGFGEGFTTGLGRGITEPFRAGSQLFASGATNPLAQGIFGPRGTGTFFKGLAGTPFAQQGVGGLFPAYQDQQGISWNQSQQVTSQTGQRPDYSQWATPQNPGGLQQTSAVTPSTQWQTAVYPDLKAATAAGVPPGTKMVSAQGGFRVDPSATFTAPAATGWLENAIGKTGANIVSQAALPLTVAGIAYAMSPKEKDRASELAQLDAANPERRAYEQWKTIADKTSDEAVRLKTIWYGQDLLSPEERFAQFGAAPPGPGGAAGGEVFGPGTGTSDSIPARLSDGEFVMTAEAVRNAGGGDRALGAARMYDMMNQFERGAA